MYPTDLTDSALKVIQEILADKRKRKYSLRAIFNALLYVTKTGYQWRQMPNDLPPWPLTGKNRPLCKGALNYFFWNPSTSSTMRAIDSIYKKLIESNLRNGPSERKPIANFESVYLQGYRTEPGNKTIAEALSIKFSGFIIYLSQYHYPSSFKEEILRITPIVIDRDDSESLQKAIDVVNEMKDVHFVEEMKDALIMIHIS